ncbi:DUF6339 family protein [Rhodococcus sp. IEGM 1379]|uniref:DUF6339 family protein n=1 Tax=Rhodococcus sp. IEGM 1379 TaxID=3047086 RepID=UPI0024B7445E|nr:DUF6339 family protein [Rhodococcus sp. IEGM 1379]MDI9918460.1 DUF6339 family protein [Rhodococcus sp. IEGM 1379]
MTELWPRLSLALGMVELRKLDGDPAQMARSARARHPQMTYAASGGRRIGESGVQELADSIRTIAHDCGYPSEVGNADLIRFDRVAAEEIHRTMQITSVEAAHREVWNFLAIVVMPDITRWRFPGENVERWIATDLTRHMFARLWWQAMTFATVVDGVPDYSLLRKLSESDLNQITERRSIAGVTPLARSIARILIEGGGGGGRRKVLRDAVPRLRRLMAFMDFSVLSDDQLDDRVRAIFREVSLEAVQ